MANRLRTTTSVFTVLVMLSLAPCLQADGGTGTPTNAGAVAVQGDLFHDFEEGSGPVARIPQRQTPSLALAGFTFAALGWLCLRGRRGRGALSPLVRFTISVGTLRVSIDCL